MSEMEFSGYAFHRALRKSLDSDASSICWNAIYLLEDGAWKMFCKLVQERTGSLKARCKDVLNYGDHARTLFLIGLRMLSDEEWEVLERRAMLSTSAEPDGP